MFAYSERTALVTGASSGIGAEFARALAARKMNLVLTARSEPPMRELADELTTRYGVRVDVVVADLSRDEGVPCVVEAVRQAGLSVDLLVNNAGLLTHGRFETIDPQREQAELTVNINSLVGLTHAFLPGMLERRAGGVINVASIAGFQPIPYMAVYGATKAFVISFSMALREECRDRGVAVLRFAPVIRRRTYSRRPKHRKPRSGYCARRNRWSTRLWPHSKNGEASSSTGSKTRC
ncbi:MAG: SDR family oxidoreductase [Pirellulales bacterium]